MPGQRVSLMPVQPTPRWGYFVVWGASLLSWVSLVSVYGFWLLARWKLGDWPRPLLDDPKMIGLDGWYVLALMGMVSYPFGLFAAITLMMFNLGPRLFGGRFWTRHRWVLYAALHALVVSLGGLIILRWDPLGVVYWMMD